jgi:hypothetical protein
MHANTQIKNGREDSVESVIKEIRDDCSKEIVLVSNKKESKKKGTNLGADTETIPKKYIPTDEIINQINKKHGIKRNENPCGKCLSNDCKDKCDLIETNVNKIEQNKVEESNDNDNYPPNNICYDCGKQLKWEHRCPDCGILSDFDFSEYTVIPCMQIHK